MDFSTLLVRADIVIGKYNYAILRQNSHFPIHILRVFL